MITNLDELQHSVGVWAAAMFPHRTALSIIRHLKEEFEELSDAVYLESSSSGWGRVSEEAAGIVLLLFSLANLLGFSLFSAAQDEFVRVQMRSWLPPDPEGVSRHDPEHEREPEHEPETAAADPVSSLAMLTPNETAALLSAARIVIRGARKLAETGLTPMAPDLLAELTLSEEKLRSEAFPGVPAP